MDQPESDPVECLIAPHLWDWTVPTTVTNQEELLERFVSEHTCNALCIWPDHQPGRFELPVEAIEDHDLPIVMYLALLHFCGTHGRDSWRSLRNK